MRRGLVACAGAWLPLFLVCTGATVTDADTNRIDHAAIGAAVRVSSTHLGLPGESGPEALVDGDLRTRWSSKYRSGQTVTLRLGATNLVDAVDLCWENAAARKYRLLTSEDGERWEVTHFYLNTAAPPERRVDRIPLNRTPVTALRLEMLQRVDPTWGFSLYEIAVFTPDKPAPPRKLPAPRETTQKKPRKQRKRLKGHR